MTSGYLHEEYARSLSEFGDPLALPRSGGWLVERAIHDTPYRDAIGCYPLFACANWKELPADLEELETRLVSVSVVTDPFGAYDEALLQRAFRDIVRPFKPHFIADLTQPRVSKHHRYYVRRALAQMQVEPVAEPAEFLDDWMQLYDSLIERHQVTGLRAFSRAAFERQLRVPGLVAFRVLKDGAVIGGKLWYVHGGVGYSHLAAFSPLGYELGASYALYDAAFTHFAKNIRWLDLGGGAGVSSRADGLTRFKDGWSSGTRMAYLCGRILQRGTYETLSPATRDTSYFPAYRSGEFA